MLSVFKVAQQLKEHCFYAVVFTLSKVRYRNNDEIKAAWELFFEMNKTPFKTIFWINETKIYTKSEGLGVVNYIGLHI